MITVHKAIAVALLLLQMRLDGSQSYVVVFGTFSFWRDIRLWERHSGTLRRMLRRWGGWWRLAKNFLRLGIVYDILNKSEWKYHSITQSHRRKRNEIDQLVSCFIYINRNIFLESCSRKPTVCRDLVLCHIRRLQGATLVMVVNTMSTSKYSSEKDQQIFKPTAVIFDRVDAFYI